MNKNKLIAELESYQSQFEIEWLFVPRFLSLLCNFPNCFYRSLITGHMTASAFIVDNERNAVLLTHHKKLDKWLQPGGHADGNENILEVAWNEAKEETGLDSLKLVSSNIFDIDIHQIPSYGRDMAHLHYDVRYLFTAEKRETFIVSEESHDLEWINLHQISHYTNGNASIERMCKKAANQDQCGTDELGL